MKFLFKLIAPFLDSVQGKLSWKEVVASLLLSALFFVFGGEFGDLVKNLLANVDITNFDPAQVVSGLVTLVIALLMRWQQGK